MAILNQSAFTTFGEWAASKQDMRIVCDCGRTINLPSANIIKRFGADGPIGEALIRLRCQTCKRRGHATVTPVSFLKL